MNKQLKKILVSILIGALVLGVSGCGAKNKAADAVDAYLKSVQEDPMSLTVQLRSGPEDPYWKAIEELLSEFEYTIVSEGEEYKDAGIGKTAKKVTVDLKGYNIGAYMQMFMENLQTERLNRFMTKDVSFGDLQHMSDKELEEFFAEIDLEFFNETMEQCRSDGKTWSKTAEILTYLDDKTNEWTVYTLKQYDILDSITNGLYSYLKDSSGVEADGETPAPSYDPGADLDKPDYEGCVLMIHVEGDYYLIGPELHFNEFVLFGDNGADWQRTNQNPVFDLVSDYSADNNTMPEYDADKLYAGFPYSPPAEEYSYSLYFEVRPYLISEEELAGVKERLSTVEFPFAFENPRTGETLSVSKKLPLIELELQ